MSEKLPNALAYSHQLLKHIISRGNTVVDCTAGNGNDTLLLANLVGKTGSVYGFDIQQTAINHTHDRLKANGLNEENIHLFTASHSQLDHFLPKKSLISAAIFNLGYLPGGDKSIITHPESTIEAIKGCLNHLKQNGLVVIVIYYGHPGGQTEKNAILDFGKSLDQKKFAALTYQFINQKHEPPFVLVIQNIAPAVKNS